MLRHTTGTASEVPGPQRRFPGVVRTWTDASSCSRQPQCRSRSRSRPPAFARRLGGTPVAYVTADLESHVVVLDLGSARGREAHSDRAGSSQHRVGSGLERGRRTHGARRRDAARRRDRLCPRRARRLRRTALHRSASAAAGRVRDRLGTRGGRRPGCQARPRAPAHGCARPCAAHRDRAPDGQTLWTALGTKAERVAVLDTTRSAAPEARPDVHAAVPRSRRRVRARRSHRLGDLGRPAADRALRAQWPCPPRHRGGLASAARHVRPREGIRRERRRRHRAPPPSRRRARPRGTCPRRLVQRDLRLGTRRLPVARPRDAQRARRERSVFAEFDTIARAAHDACIVFGP